MTTPTTPRIGSRRKLMDEMKASDERRRASWSPAEKAIAQASEMTAGESAALNAATAEVVQCQAALAKLVLRKQELEEDTRDDAEEWTDSGGVFSRLVRKPPDPARVAAAKDELADTPLRMEVARGSLQVAVRESNAIGRKVSDARARRRLAAEAKHATPYQKPKPQASAWDAYGGFRRRGE